MGVDGFEWMRRIVLGVTGAICLAYAGGVIMAGGPRPFAPWLPGSAGVLSGLAIYLAWRADKRVARMASDEGYAMDWGRAQRHAYWVALGLYPVFGLLLGGGIVDFEQAFAAIGTLTGGAVLTLFVIYDLMGRSHGAE